MRRRASDPDIWGDLYDRFRRPDDPPRRPRGVRSLTPESRTLLIDAALGILGSVRTFVDVAEDILLERRSGHAEAPPADPWVREQPAAWPDDRTDDEGSAVRDIPLHGA
jgi:hypothetical protein